MQFDEKLIQELRELADRGTPPSQLVGVVGNRLGVGDINFRLLAIAYFRKAFALPLADATRIGAASIFPDSRGNDHELDTEVTPIIRGTRHLWGPE
jgi:hypothetical protein